MGKVTSFTTSAQARGFTIVELLIVIVVIAILAAITIVAYNGIQNRSYDTTLQSDMRQSFQRIERFKTENSANRYPNVGAEFNQTLVTTRSAYHTGENALIFCWNDTDAGIVGRSRSGAMFGYSSATGPVSLPSWPGNGNAQLCPKIGIPTASTGYSNTWLYANGAWTSWYTPGN